MVPRPHDLPSLDVAALTKAMGYQRALRRAALAYWYATVGDSEAARLEASLAALVVNILDEGVFLEAGRDLLASLSEPTDWAFSLERILMVEEYQDLYLDMRRGT